MRSKAITHRSEKSHENALKPKFESNVNSTEILKKWKKIQKTNYSDEIVGQKYWFSNVYPFASVNWTTGKHTNATQTNHFNALVCSDSAGTRTLVMFDRSFLVRIWIGKICTSKSANHLKIASFTKQSTIVFKLYTDFIVLRIFWSEVEQFANFNWAHWTSTPTDLERNLISLLLIWKILKVMKSNIFFKC